MAEPICHYCDRPAAEECPTCGRLYCSEHGEDVCLRCLSPESAAPSVFAYRGSIAALVVASAVAVFLFVKPPQSKSPETVKSLATSTPSFSTTATATRPGGAPAPTSTPNFGSPTPRPTAPGATSTPGGQRTYVVKDGDTLGGIAVQLGTTVNEIVAINPGLDPDALTIGAELKIPAAR